MNPVDYVQVSYLKISELRVVTAYSPKCLVSTENYDTTKKEKKKPGDLHLGD